MGGVLGLQPKCFVLILLILHILLDSSLLQENVAFILCLDTVGSGNSLHLHVSKPPKEGTLQHAFLNELETVND